MSILLSQQARKLLWKSFRLPYPIVNEHCKVITLVCGSSPNSFITLVNRKYSDKKQISVRKADSEIQTDVKVTVKEATKTVSYSAVILLGIGVTAALFYAVFRELFSSKSPSGVYSNAFKLCSNDTRIQDALGTPIKGFGEETSRGRRRHVNQVSYQKEGVPHMRMVFYLKGSRNSGTVHLEVKENNSGDFEYRYLFVQLDDYGRRVIVLEDNRAKEEAAKSFLTPLDDISILK
ncbi:mitochondrial import inner membrane translocase subunit Tim21 [Halyomorpha halys]|uniref:mitochondrial import inner membrane translocase subunit Tim21 n=1 Tax=Halyomorpha halys TaxID=286706 RepID=UPI0006D5262E|nr:mitochondrial import inner membrane translocase subunit Tim21 [Halyomorpha halys]